MEQSKKGRKTSFPNMNACTPQKPTKELGREDILEMYQEIAAKKAANINETVKKAIENAMEAEFPGLRMSFDWPTSGTGTTSGLKVTNIAVRDAKVDRKKS